jgi:hypothetical protein
VRYVNSDDIKKVYQICNAKYYNILIRFSKASHRLVYYTSKILLRKYLVPLGNYHWEIRNINGFLNAEAVEIDVCLSYFALFFKIQLPGF